MKSFERLICDAGMGLRAARWLVLRDMESLSDMMLC